MRPTVELLLLPPLAMRVRCCRGRSVRRSCCCCCCVSALVCWGCCCSCWGPFPMDRLIRFWRRSRPDRRRSLVVVLGVVPVLPPALLTPPMLLAPSRSVGVDVVYPNVFAWSTLCAASGWFCCGWSLGSRGDRLRSENEGIRLAALSEMLVSDKARPPS